MKSYDLMLIQTAEMMAKKRAEEEIFVIRDKKGRFKKNLSGPKEEEKEIGQKD